MVSGWWVVVGGLVGGLEWFQCWAWGSSWTIEAFFFSGWSFVTLVWRNVVPTCQHLAWQVVIHIHNNLYRVRFWSARYTRYDNWLNWYECMNNHITFYSLFIISSRHKLRDQLIKLNPLITKLSVSLVPTSICQPSLNLASIASSGQGYYCIRFHGVCLCVCVWVRLAYHL